MNGNDIGPFRIALHDIRVALALLTRLPLPYPAQRDRPAAMAAWAYPLAGAVVAFLVWGVIWCAGALGLGLGLSPILGLLVGIMVTGAMHEDGLADCADGFWGGWTRERRLEIMKDSQIGTYGVLALVLSLMLRWGALVGLVQIGMALPALLVAAMGSRAGMVWMMRALPNARDDGLSKQTGRPPKWAAGTGISMAAAVLLVIWPWGVFQGALIAALFALGCAWLAKRKIGGQTGDVLGASQQVIETALLVTAAALFL